MEKGRKISLKARQETKVAPKVDSYVVSKCRWKSGKNFLFLIFIIKIQYAEFLKQKNLAKAKIRF